jgi:hypothetical protein
MPRAIIEQKHVRTSVHEEILVQNPSKEIKNKMSANNESIFRCDREYASANLGYRLTITVCLKQTVTVTSGTSYADRSTFLLRHNSQIGPSIERNKKDTRQKKICF